MRGLHRYPAAAVRLLRRRPMPHPAWLALLLLCALTSGSTCERERGVDVVVGAEMIAPIRVRGEGGALRDTLIVDVASGADLPGIIRSNGLEGRISGRVESAAYRVTQPDAEDGRTITGTLSVNGAPLVEFSSVVVRDHPDWTPLPLVDSGVGVVNSVLAAYFDALAAGDPHPPEPVMLVTIALDSSPADVATDFDWEVRLRLNLVGRKQVRVFEPL